MRPEGAQTERDCSLRYTGGQRIEIYVQRPVPVQIGCVPLCRAVLCHSMPGPAGPARRARQLCRYLEYPGTLGKGANQVPMSVRGRKVVHRTARLAPEAKLQGNRLVSFSCVACCLFVFWLLQQIILSDRIATTPEMAPIFAEALLLMPHCYIVPPPSRPLPHPHTRTHVPPLLLNRLSCCRSLQLGHCKGGLAQCKSKGPGPLGVLQCHR